MLLLTLEASLSFLRLCQRIDHLPQRKQALVDVDRLLDRRPDVPRQTPRVRRVLLRRVVRREVALPLRACEIDQLQLARDNVVRLIVVHLCDG